MPAWRLENLSGMRAFVVPLMISYAFELKANQFLFPRRFGCYEKHEENLLYAVGSS